MPVNGALSITSPTSYGNLITNTAKCNMTMPYPAYCDISTANRVDIYLNGSVLDQTMTYKIWVTGLSNPNTNNMTGLVFQFTSYFDSNIYRAHKICENPITPPTIMMKSIRNCGFSINLDFHNSGLNAKYNFLISCTDVIRTNSILYIYTHSNYNISNPISLRTCYSYESTTLVSPNCSLQYINGSYALVVPIKSSSNQVSLTLQTDFINPTAGIYSFSGKFFSDGMLVSTTNNYSRTIFNNTYSTGLINQVSLNNVPRGAGTSSYYIFKVPAMNITGTSPDSLTINFPSNFINNIGETISATVITSTDSTLLSKLTYLNLNQITTNYSNSLALYASYSTPSTVNVLDSIVRISGLGALLKSLNSSVWVYYIVKGVLNPSKYLNQTFKLIYS